MFPDSFFTEPWRLIGTRLVLASVAASLGALVAVSFKKISHTWLCLLISFAAGSLLSVVIFDIWPETKAMIGAGPALISGAIGYTTFFLITKLVSHMCPACAATHTEANFKSITLAMVFALSIHSFMDGLAIYSGHAFGLGTGILILIAVAYHKFPEGLALSLIAMASGMSRMRAFVLTVTLETLTTLAGGIVGLLFLLPHASTWMGYVLAHVGGGFVYLVIHALFSEMIKHNPRNTVLAALAGALSVWITGMCLHV